jgi:hypothetical protein
MDPLALADQIADPVQVLGMSYYFDPGTAERATELGMNVVQFYGMGRGGVLGAVDVDAVDRAFYFFHRRSIEYFWALASEDVDPAATAREHVESAKGFARRTFGGVDADLLTRVADAGYAAVDAAPRGRYPLVDGYRALPRPDEPVDAAYLAMIMLRELRGAVHIDAVVESELSPSEAAFVQDPMIFKLHGYTDDDEPAVTEGLEERKRRAEDATSAVVAGFFASLSPDARAALAEGVAAMAAALLDPEPVVA